MQIKIPVLKFHSSLPMTDETVFADSIFNGLNLHIQGHVKEAIEGYEVLSPDSKRVTVASLSWTVNLNLLNFAWIGFYHTSKAFAK